jgi:hypothetical protein
MLIAHLLLVLKDLLIVMRIQLRLESEHFCVCHESVRGLVEKEESPSPALTIPLPSTPIYGIPFRFRLPLSYPGDDGAPDLFPLRLSNLYRSDGVI